MPQPRKGARRRSEPKLIGAKESALLCDVKQSNLRVLKGLPEPYDTIAATTLWRADEMVAFAALRLGVDEAELRMQFAPLLGPVQGDGP